jgi:hypothetical protein
VKAPFCLRLLVAVYLIVSCGSVLALTPQAADNSRNSSAPAKNELVGNVTEIGVPGPLRSFLRMAGISQKITAVDVMPLLARNIYMQGYEGGNRPTEFLVLLNRYVQQARELATFASSGSVIRIANCDEAKPLLKILGYRVREECGKNDTALETADPERAFVTIDSGFPLAGLEQTLQGGKAFEYPYPMTPVPIFFSASEWMSAGTKKDQRYTKDLIDTLLHDPDMARLYWSFSRLDPETRDALQRTVGLRELMPDAAVLDFYGSYICLRSGHIVVPGGEGAVPAWKSLVGANPDSPRDFVRALVSKDMGWMAAYFDVLSRASRRQQVRFTEGKRLRTFYDALRAADPNSSATKGAFRPAPGLLLLVTRQQWDTDGEPHVPGGVAVWKDILRQKSDSKLVREWGKRANRLTTPEQLLQAMFALTRATTDSGPLQAYLMLSEVDMRRSEQHRLTPETVKLLARRFELFSDQYRVFAEFPDLTDASLELFLDVANSMDHIDNTALRGNALGTLQANIGIWQILARQGQIPTARLNESWQGAIKPFAKIRNQAQVYEAGYTSIGEVLRAATGKPRTSQSELIELLASPRQTNPDAKKAHEEVATAMRTVLDSQRLVSLDVIHGLGQGLQDKLQGKGVDPSVQGLAEQLREFEMPRPIFKGSERSEWAAGIYNNSHTDAEMRADVGKVLSSNSSRGQIEEALGQLASFQRDTLVGLNYAYYAPPGAQALHNNPLLVRSHDFSAETVGGIKAVWQASHLFGEGSPAGGGAHLVGSLADLPYVLAEIEQDFIVPENVQALIWRELVPGLMTSAVLPRWWGVGGSELHAITLYQKSGEELLAAAAQKPELREQVMVILADRMTPQRSERVERALRNGHIEDAISQVTPADTLYLAVEFRRRAPDVKDVWGEAGRELESLSREHADEIDWARLSRDFGVPHPTLAQTYTRELLNIAPVPAFAGYSSRLLAESWDSGNLYWARLADETGASPEALNRLVPELTRRMVEKVFATDFEDWPALVRALRETGDEFRHNKVASVNSGGNSSAR